MDSKIIFSLAVLVLFSGCLSDTYILDITEPINVSYSAVDEIQITGKGQGVYKTTTGIYENTIYEGFGVLDTLYSTWLTPSTLDYDKSAEIVFKFFVPTSELGKTMKLAFKYTLYDGNKFVNVTNINYTTLDLNVSETPYQYFEYRLPMDLALLEECVDNCVISGSIQRVASTNDYSGDINLFSMIAEYYDFRPTLPTGISEGLWYTNGTEIYTNATAVNIGGYKMYDNGTDFIFEVN